MFVAFGQGLESKNTFNGRQYRRVIVTGGVNESFGDKWRYDHSRHPHTQLSKIKVVEVVCWIGCGISGSNGLRWGNMVIKPSMLIVCEEQPTVFPVRCLANRLVNRLQQSPAARHVILRMLRITTGKMPQNGMSIIRLDKCVGCSITRVVQVTAEVFKVPEVSLESTNVHAAYGK